MGEGEMRDEWPVMKEIYPSLIQNYICFEVAAFYVKAQDEQND